MTSARRNFVIAFSFGSTCIAATAGYLGARPPGPGAAEAGILPFVLSDFGGVSLATLETGALPYKVAATGLIMRAERIQNRPHDRTSLKAIYREFGFIFPDSIANWPRQVPAPRFERPVGMVGRMVKGPTPIARIDAVNIGCSTCHTGLLHDSTGSITSVAWAGLPNTSLNLELYTQAVYEGLKIAVSDTRGFRARVHRLFPEMSARERITLKWFLMPRVAKRMEELKRSGDRALPFSSGGAGRPNGPGAIKRSLGIPQSLSETGFVSTPALAGRGVRRTLLVDGVYATNSLDREIEMNSSEITDHHIGRLAEITSFFLVGTMGMQPDAAERAIPELSPVLQWIARESMTPPFPGRIDSVAADAGEKIFARSCATCHGSYSPTRPRRIVSYPNRHVPSEEIGTDPGRLETLNDDVVAKVTSLPYGRHLNAERTESYVAPILLGIWATAPYLHNGSVPTLWHLLSPAERPARFMVGGHALDMRNVGIDGMLDSAGTYRFRAEYTPWSTPEIFDTTSPGLSNRGHERQFSRLNETQKRELIEYLKTL